MGLFATPKTQEELLSWIELHNGEERAIMMLAMGYTWNYLAHTLETHNEENSNDHNQTE